MSMIVMDGFKFDESIDEEIKTQNLFWYDNINTKIMIGSKVVNYYIDNTTQEKIITLLTQTEMPNIVIRPVEFTILEPIA